MIIINNSPRHYDILHGNVNMYSKDEHIIQSIRMGLDPTQLGLTRQWLRVTPALYAARFKPVLNQLYQKLNRMEPGNRGTRRSGTPTSNRNN
jgi:hypothetical protein